MDNLLINTNIDNIIFGEAVPRRYYYFIIHIFWSAVTFEPFLRLRWNFLSFYAKSNRRCDLARQNSASSDYRFRTRSCSRLKFSIICSSGFTDLLKFNNGPNKPFNAKFKYFETVFLTRSSLRSHSRFFLHLTIFWALQWCGRVCETQPITDHYLEVSAVDWGFVHLYFYNNTF